MTHNRLDDVLSRNRTNRVRDLAGAALLTLVVLFSSLSFAAKLPALSYAPQRAPRESDAIAARAAAEMESNAVWQAAIDEQDAQPFGV